MFKKLSFLFACAAIAVLSSCSSKMSSMKSEYFTVTPSVLEVVGSEVPVTVDGKFPAKVFNKKSVLTVTPVLKYEGGEALAEPVVFQGEKVRGNDRVISYDNGGSFKTKMTFDYVPAMEDAELYLRFVVNKGNKTYTLPDVKIADGCIATSQLYRQTATSANIAYGEDAFQRVIKQAKEANIMFLIQQTNLRASQLTTEEMKELKATMAEIVKDFENKVLDEVEVSAYASPDGGVALNDNVATGRELNTAKFVKKEMKKAKLEGHVDSKYTAEDWEGFQELVSKSELPDKELILRVLSMYEDPEEREAQIKNISSVYSASGIFAILWLMAAVRWSLPQPVLRPCWAIAVFASTPTMSATPTLWARRLFCLWSTKRSPLLRMIMQRWNLVPPQQRHPHLPSPSSQPKLRSRQRG